MKLISQIKSSKFVQKIANWAQESSLPGFEGIPVWSVIRLMYFEMVYGNLFIRANAMAFTLFISIFPALIMLITLVPYIPVQNFDTMLYNYVFEFLPSSAEAWIGTTINDLSRISRGGLLSVSFFLVVYFASNGMAMTITGFEKSFDSTFKDRNFFQTRFTALWMTILMFLMIISAVVVVIATNYMMDYMMTYVIHAQNLKYLTGIVNALLTVLIFYSMIAVIYQYAPAFRKKPGFLTPGSLLATLMFIITSLGFAYYVNNFGNYNKIYGSIGAVIVLMVWLELNCFILLLGFELNASIALNRDIGSIKDYDSYKEYRLGNT
ncbi:MAG TPA: YihY/virulence factor BrkB family protein [Membranihabitans sp.]|nr:YihY/virulence factor BrkB family protein [Membranihabitans sp.]